MGNKRKSNNKRKSPPPEAPKPSSSDAKSPRGINGSAAALRSRRRAEPEPSPPSKKQTFWSKESELALLKLIIRFNAQNRNDHASVSKNDFLAFLAQSLGGVFRESQINDKINRMKRRYLNDAAKETPPSDPHEREIFDLAAELWGPITSNGDVPAPIVKQGEKRTQDNDPEEEQAQKFDFDLEGSDFGHVSAFFDKASHLIGISNVGTNGELERMKKEIRVAEIELFLKRTELLKKQLLMALEASKSCSDSLSLLMMLPPSNLDLGTNALSFDPRAIIKRAGTCTCESMDVQVNKSFKMREQKANIHYLFMNSEAFVPTWQLIASLVVAPTPVLPYLSPIA